MLNVKAKNYQSKLHNQSLHSIPIPNKEIELILKQKSI